MKTLQIKTKKIIAVAVAAIMAAGVVYIDAPLAFALSSDSEITTNDGVNTITLEDCKAGKRYVVSVVKGSLKDHEVSAESLLYIDQKTATGSTVEFEVPIKTSERVVVLASSNDNRADYPIAIGEANTPVSDVSFDVTNPKYTGKTVEPVIAASYGGKDLTLDEDYAVTIPAVKNVGDYSFRTEGLGLYTGTAEVAFQVVPPPRALKKVVKGKKKMTVKWKGLSKSEKKKYKNQIKGFQIQYGLKDDFSDAKIVSGGGVTKSSKVIKGLKSKKKYYVRLRTYKGKCYSDWSKTKTVVVK